MENLWQNSEYPAPIWDGFKGQDVRVGPLRLGMGPTGLALDWDGVPVIKGSSLWAVAPNWSKHYLGLRNLEKWTVQPHQDGLLVTGAAPEGRGLSLALRYFLSPKGLNCELLAISETDSLILIENALAYLAGELLAGGELTRNKESIQIPLAPVVRELFTQSGEEMSLSTPLGDIQLKASHSFRLFDARLDGGEWARVSPVFWLGQDLELPAMGSLRASLDMTIVGQDQASLPDPVFTAIPRGGSTPVAIQPLSAEIQVVPSPQQLTPNGEAFRPGDGCQILLETGDPTVMVGVEELRADWAEHFGVQLGLGRAQGETAPGSVLLHLGGEGPPEGYTLDVTAGGVKIQAVNPIGLYWGIQTLRQLVIAGEYGQPEVAGVQVRDWPDMPLRGLHLMVDDKALEVHKDLITRLMSPYKMNHILLECEHVLWDATREIHLDRYMSKEDLRELVAFAKDRGITITPLIQSLGHMEWFFENDKNLDLAEDPEAKYAVNPSHPRVFEILSGVMEEAVEICGSPYLHLGHDEATMIGRFPHQPENLAKGLNRIIAESVNMYRDHFAPKGVQMMIWSDLLLGPGEGPSAHAPSLEAAQELRELIPTDVIMADWHYWGKEFPSVKILGEAGYPVVGCTWKAPDSLVAFSQEVAQQKALGMICTTWLGYATHRQGALRFPDQFSAYVLQAEYAWSAQVPAYEDLAYDPAAKLLTLWQEPQEKAPGILYTLSHWQTLPLRGRDWLGQGPAQDLTGLAGESASYLSGICFQLTEAAVATGSRLTPQRLPREIAGILVGDANRQLAFLHGTSWPARPQTQVGLYRVRYTDGETVEIPLIYSVNIHAWTDPRALPEGRSAWMGKAENGARLGLPAMLWTNPHPEKVISHIDLVATDPAAGPFLLALTGIR